MSTACLDQLSQAIGKDPSGWNGSFNMLRESMPFSTSISFKSFHPFSPLHWVFVLLISWCNVPIFFCFRTSPYAVSCV